MKGIVTLKESLIEQIDRHQEAMESLEKNIAILDSFLKESSFTKASQLPPAEGPPPEPEESKPEAQNSIPITQGKAGRVIANAFVTPEQISIVLDEEVKISADTPPFKSFFLDRILGEMKRKDSADADSGKIQRESVIDYVINKDGPDIREIVIRNYRQKERVNELVNTAGWSLSRMLEKINK